MSAAGGDVERAGRESNDGGVACRGVRGSGVSDSTRGRVLAERDAAGPMSCANATFGSTGSLHMQNDLVGQRERTGNEGVLGGVGGWVTITQSTACEQAGAFALSACAPAAQNSIGDNAEGARHTRGMAGDIGSGGAVQGEGRLTATAGAVTRRPSAGEAALAACTGQHVAAVAWMPWFTGRAWEMRGLAADLVGWNGRTPRFALRDFGIAEGKRFWNDPLLNHPSSGTKGGDDGSGAGGVTGRTNRPGIAAVNHYGRVASCRAAGPMDHARGPDTFPFLDRPTGEVEARGALGPPPPCTSEAAHPSKSKRDDGSLAWTFGASAGKPSAPGMYGELVWNSSAGRGSTSGGDSTERGGRRDGQDESTGHRGGELRR